MSAPTQSTIMAHYMLGEPTPHATLRQWIDALDGTPGSERKLRLFAADCAAHVSGHLTDPRPLAAIVAARAFARGAITRKQLAAASAASYSAASYSYSAACAFSSAYSAASSAASYAAAAAASSAGASASASFASYAAGASSAERRWQTLRLALWFSDHEPEDWPIADNTRKEPNT